MSAREEMLSRVRRAQVAGAAPGRDAPSRGYRRAGEGVRTADELVELLVDRLVDYQAVVTTTSQLILGEAISGVLARHAVRRVVVPEGFPASATPSGADLVRDDPTLTSAELDAIDAVVTTSAVAIADTGTIVLDAGRGMGRRALTLVPDLHVVVVRRTDVVLGVPEALTRLDPVQLDVARRTRSADPGERSGRVEPR